MPARIRSTRHTVPAGPVVGPILSEVSRDDLRRGNQLVLFSIDAATTYSWTLSFTPTSTGGGVNPLEGVKSTAALLAPEGATSQTAKFNVDLEGSYLVQLKIDAGLPSEDVQFVRMRYLTYFGDIPLVAAGERRDDQGVIPIDVDPEGWANDQNANLQRVLLMARRSMTSGRCLYVDANRGRDRSQTPNDITNLVDFPGPEPSDRVTSGMVMQSEGFGDFSSINDAIAYAIGAVGRGEPAPSFTDPYVIFVQPGFYQEDLSLKSHVHIIGMGSKPFARQVLQLPGTQIQLAVTSVVVQSVNSGGATHEYSPTGGLTTDACIVQNVLLENVDSVTTEPVLKHTNGLLILQDVALDQKGDGASQGPAFGQISASPTDDIACYILNSAIQSRATSADRYALVHDAAHGQVWVFDSVIEGYIGGVLGNPNLYSNSCLFFAERTKIAGLHGTYDYRGYCDAQLFQDCSVQSRIVIDAMGAGPASKAGFVTARISQSTVFADIVFDIAGAVGATTLLLEGSTFTTLQFPNGRPTSEAFGFQGYSVAYKDAWTDPAPPFNPAVPVTSQLGVSTVQDAIDRLINLVFPLGVPPYLSLETAYNGLASFNPPIIGGGLGRTIIADDDSVQIIAANPPIGPPIWVFSSDMSGWLQVEAGVDIGALDSSGVGSEISLRPNPFQAGPVIQMGRSVWPDDGGSLVRGITAATILAGLSDSPSAPPGNPGYHLRAKTKSAQTSGVDSLGRIIIEGGNTTDLGPGGPQPGEVYVQAGDYLNGGGAGPLAHIWVSPGTSVPLADDGYVYLVKPSDSLPTTLVPAGAFVGGVGGTIYFTTPNGVYDLQVFPGDNAAQFALSVSATGVLVGTVVGPAVHITTAQKGPNADVLYIGDDQGGALNIAVGDYTLTGGAVLTPGSFPSKVGLRCIADTVLEVNGSIVASGSSWIHSTVDVTTAAGPIRHILAAPTSYVGCDTTVPPNGVITVELPNTVLAGAVDGRQVVIKDQAGGVSTPGWEIHLEVGPVGPPQGTIDGGPLVILNLAYQSATVVCRGIGGGGFAEWYLV